MEYLYISTGQKDRDRVRKQINNIADSMSPRVQEFPSHKNKGKGLIGLLPATNEEALIRMISKNDSSD